MEPQTLVEVAIPALIKSALLVFALLTAFAYMTYTERRVMALLQVRIGPNRAGPWGLLQPVADGIKLFVKEELIPADADRIIFILAPIVTVIPALVMMAVVPFGPPILVGSLKIPLQITDLNVGILYIFSVASIAVYG